MDLNRQDFKKVKKIEEIIKFCIDYKRDKLHRNYKHINTGKIQLYINENSIKFYYSGVVVVTVIIDKSSDSKVYYQLRKNPDIFEARAYSTDELFNISVQYSNPYFYDRLRLHQYIKSEHKFILGNIDYDIICDGCNAIKTQYRSYRSDMWSMYCA